MPEKLIISLLLTLMLEILFALLWGLRKRNLLLVVFINLLTNPAVVLWNYLSCHMGYVICVIIPELTAIVVETVILLYFSKGVKKPLLLGIFINVFSYNAGIILEMIFRRLFL